MTDRYQPIIDLTDYCFSGHGNVAITNEVIEINDDSMTASRTTPIAVVYPRRRRVISAPPHVQNEVPIEILDTPPANTESSNRRRKVARTKKKRQTTLTNPDLEDTVRDRSPLGGNFGTCPICLEALRTQPLVSTRCGHVYCAQCLTQALRTEKKCPSCRKSLRGNTAYHPLFLNIEE